MAAAKVGAAVGAVKVGAVALSARVALGAVLGAEVSVGVGAVRAGAEAAAVDVVRVVGVGVASVALLGVMVGRRRAKRHREVERPSP